jgi:carbamate kinase
MRIVAALGGNALLERGEPPESDIQEAHVVTAVRAAGTLIAVPDDDASGRSHELAAFG